MSEVPKIIEDFLKGNNDAGGTVAKLEEEASRLVSQIESLETTNHRLRTENDNEYDAALEWAASWITGAQIFPVGRLCRPRPSAGNANRWAYTLHKKRSHYAEIYC